MQYQFTKAVAHKLKLKLLIMGEAGTGKTWWSLALATRLVDIEGGKIALIDTEGADGKAQLYAPYFDFDHLVITDHSPETYQKAIHAAIAQKYTVVIVDSFTQEWNGKNGVLEIADNHKQGWAHAKPRHRALIHSIHDAKIHIIGTVRAKTAYGKQDDGNIDWKTSDIEARQEGEFEYEWDMSAILDHNHTLSIRKTRCFEITSGTEYSTDEDQTIFAQELHTWLNAGEAPPHWTQNQRQMNRVNAWLDKVKSNQQYALHLAGAVADIDKQEFDTPEAYTEAIRDYCKPEAALQRKRIAHQKSQEQTKTIQLRPLPVAQNDKVKVEDEPDSEGTTPPKQENIFADLLPAATQ